ncbi:MAG: ATPase, partial [Raoultibacter sp.]
TRSGSSISVPTIKRYVTALSDAFVFYPIKRFDIKGKKCFDNPDKYYIVDVGLRNYLSHYKNADQGRSLENIVLLQLLYDGFDVTVGSLYQTEVDFIATKGSDTIYIQVTDSMEKEDTLERELKPLRSIRDAHTKIVVVGHGSYPTDIDGIKIITATNFLLGSN